MTRTASKPLPKPFYAAAGAGDLVVEQVTRQLRRLPDTVDEWRDRATEAATQARTKMSDTASGIDVRADLTRMRQAARDRASAFAVAAQRQANVASERGAALYEQLAARGAKIMNGAKPSTPARLAAVPDEAAKSGNRKPAARKPAKASQNGTSKVAER